MPGLGLGLGLSRGGGVRAAWTPADLPGTTRLWLPGQTHSYTDGSASFTAASSQYLSVASNSTLQTGGVDWWISGWFKQASTTSNRCIAAKDSNTLGREWGAYTASGSTNLVFETSGASRLVVSLGSLNQWHQVLLWFDTSDNKCRASIDGGTPVVASTGVAISSGTAPFYLGGRAFSGSLIPWDGFIASVAFGKSPPGGIASVATTIRDRLYASGAGIVYADTTIAERTAWGLVSWWDLVRSGVFTDSHGSNNLTNNNGVGFGAGLPRALAGDTDPVSLTTDRLQGTTWSEADPLKRLTLRDLGGGRWVWRSDGINDGLGHGPATTGARTIAMAYTQTVAAAGTRVVQSASGVNSLVSPRRAGGGNVTTGGNVVRNTAFGDDSDPHVFVMSRGASGPWRVWLDGTLVAVTDQTDDFGSLGIGHFTGAAAAETFTGDKSCVVDNNTEISDTDRAKLTTYLASLYGGVL